MTSSDWAEIFKDMGPVAGLAVFVFYVLAKNGMLKVVMRDSSADELSALHNRIDELAKDVADLKTDVAIVATIQDERKT